ncbi:MAG: hypothetical protein GY862_09020, partial [Gammaproteobacteria bacterium]|nr:hypothetical protein [Gammaproteobacteria bacterium]
GIYVYDFKIPETARTGKWRATVKWKYKTIGHYDFQVEEFIPNKIQVKVEQLSIHRVHAGDVLEFKVKALSSFGPPAIGYQVNGNIRLYPHKFKPSGYAGFNFGHQDTRFPGIEHALPEARLDEQGHHLYRYPIQKGIDSPSGLMAVYSATILDSSGRGVTAYGETPVLLYRQFVGIRRLSEDIIYSEQPLGFETVNVNSDGKPIARDRQQLDFKVYLKKKIAHYRKNERGYYRYVIETKRVLMDELADPRDDLGNFFYTPHYDGLHVLEVTDQAGGQVSRYPFTVKGHTADVKTVVAGNKVQLNILGDDVSIDEKLKLEISSPFPGKVLLIGEREKILFTRVLDMEQHKTIVTLPIKPDYLPNFYISATAVKPVSQGSRRDPIYATGLLNVPVKDKSHTPAIHLRVSHKQARPQDRIRIFLKVDDTNRTDMHYTVAAVDTGILELTGYRLPDMAGYFNQKRRLEVQHYNMYKLVMPYEPEAKYSISPSGDMAPAESLIKKKQVNNPRVKPVALWSGLRKLNARGEGDVTFKLPDFDGKLRVMAVTFGDQRFASAQREITVRDKLVLKSGLPRFLANGDKFMIPVSLFNGIGKDGDIKLNIQVSDHIALHGHASKTVFMADKAEALEYFTAEAGQESGEAAVTLRAEGMGEFTQRTVKLPVRPASAIQHTGGSGTVSRETPKTIAFPIDFIPDTQQLAMRISSNRLAYFQNSLSYLLRYPHGSLEQTISKLFPLLYYSDMANSMGQISNTQKTLLDQLKQGIAKLERMQMENGAFAYWEGENNVNDWASIYAVHFMVEVQQQGHRIRTTAWDGMLGWLRQSVSEKPEAADAPGISHYIYALYVLGFAGGNTLAKLNNLYDMHMQGLKPHDKARLAAAFHTSGDDLTARRILRGITKFSEYDQPYRDTGGSFASNTRDLAIILDVMTQVIPDSPQIPRLVGKLAKQMREGRWASTQENAFAFLAVGKALRGNAMQIQAKISLGDGTRIPFENNVLLGTPELLKGSVRIEVSGDGELNYAWEAAGVMQTPESLQQDQGVHIRRRFLDRKGNPLDLRNVQQGNLAVAEIKIKSLSGKLENVAITDLLPMGLEIGNFRLINSPVLAWMKADLAPEYLDIRDDRINIFVSLSESEKTYYYLTRAVTAGEFKIPAIRAEAMYDPDIFSESGSGTLKIIPRQRSTAIPERATSIVSDAGNAAVLPAETALVTEDSSQETGPVIERPFKGNCTMLPKKVYLRRRGALQLPATGFVARKAHCVTTDEFPDHYPRSDSEAINTHLVDSCNLLKVRYPEFINGISPDCNEIYQCANKRHGACIWTSAGNGSTFGQGSAGNLRPEPVEEAWLGTMDWEPGTRPEPGTRFIIQNPANNKTAVIIMGYETGPAYGKWLAGISPEADWYLEANWSLGDALQGQTELRIGQAKHQNLQPGPINCQ